MPSNILNCVDGNLPHLPCVGVTCSIRVLVLHLTATAEKGDTFPLPRTPLIHLSTVTARAMCRCFPRFVPKYRIGSRFLHRPSDQNKTRDNENQGRKATSYNSYGRVLKNQRSSPFFAAFPLEIRSRFGPNNRSPGPNSGW